MAEMTVPARHRMDTGQVDWMKLLRLAVWITFCVLLLVLA